MCPPKGSHTALNHYLKRAENIDFEQELRQELIELTLAYIDNGIMSMSSNASSVSSKLYVLDAI